MNEKGTDKQSEYQALKDRLSEISGLSELVLKQANDVINFQKRGEPTEKPSDEMKTSAMPTSWLGQLNAYADVINDNLNQIKSILHQLT